MSYSVFNVKELVVALKTADDPAGLLGPSFGEKVRWHGAQKIAVNLQQEQVQLLGDGLILDAQSSLDRVEVQIEAALVTPEVEAVIYGMAHTETPEETRLIWHEDSGGNYVGVWARTDKVGANGEDVVLFLPSVQFSTLNRDQTQRQYRTNQFSGSALFTKSTYPVEAVNSAGELVTEQKRIIMMESNRRVAASMIVPIQQALTVETVFPITGHVVGNDIVIELSESLKRATVNRFTVWLKTAVGNTLIPCAIKLGDVNGKTDNQLTLNPASPLAAATAYTVVLKRAIQDVYGNRFTAEQELSVTTAS